MTKNREYKPLIIPQLKWEKKTLSETCGELVVQPLEPGFGITIGNSLRRIFLSGVEGSAITSVIIKGVNNEFSAIPGVVEDVSEIILNLKQVRLKLLNKKPGKIVRLKV